MLLHLVVMHLIGCCHCNIKPSTVIGWLHTAFQFPAFSPQNPFVFGGLDGSAGECIQLTTFVLLFLSRSLPSSRLPPFQRSTLHHITYSHLCTIPPPSHSLPANINMTSPTMEARVKNVLSGDTVVLTHLQKPTEERILSLAYVSAPRMRRDNDEVSSHSM